MNNNFPCGNKPTARKRLRNENSSETLFTFQPVFSAKSKKIAAKLKTDFLERQSEHIIRQKEKIAERANSFNAYTSTKFSPSRQYKLSKKPHSTPCIKSPNLKECSLTSSDSNLRRGKCASSTVMHLKGNNSITTKIQTHDDSTKHSEVENRVGGGVFTSGKRITCCQSSNKNLENKNDKTLNKENRVENDVECKNKDVTRKCADENPITSVPFKSEGFGISYQLLQKLKRIAFQAIQDQKVFICNGPYAKLRGALWNRGWIEKHFKVKGSNEEIKVKFCHDIEGEYFTEAHCDIMSRIVRHAPPTFIWTIKRENISFMLLRKEQIVNHYMSAWMFTTKSGLCTHLRSLRHFTNCTADFFFPRCYRLCCDDEKDDFLNDFRMTAMQGLMKIVLSKSSHWRVMEERKNEGSTPESGKKPRKVPKPVSSELLLVAFRTCYAFLDSKAHLDIEEDFVADSNIDDMTWQSLIQYYYKVSRDEVYILNAWKHAGECGLLLTKLQTYFPQMKLDGLCNVWIVKPGAKSRGRGIQIMNELHSILSLSSDSVKKKEERWVIQKYIERPFLIHRTKFDIRQWFLVTDWNPLMLWMYKDCYIRLCGQEFRLDDFGAQYHLSNYAVQKQFTNENRSKHLPESNMWFCSQFKEYLKLRGFADKWEKVIYPGMKTSLFSTLQCCQTSLEYRKNSFELYGADFMLDEDLQPWLIEINSSPSLGASTDVTRKLCDDVINDTMKVVLDRREHKGCDVGKFELAFKQPSINIPTYMGCRVSIKGVSIQPPAQTKSARIVRRADDSKCGEEPAKTVEAKTPFVREGKKTESVNIEVCPANSQRVASFDYRLKMHSAAGKTADQETSERDAKSIRLKELIDELKQEADKQGTAEKTASGFAKKGLPRVAPFIGDPYNIKNAVTLHRQKIKNKKPKVNNKKQFGLLVAEEMTGLQKMRNLAPQLERSINNSANQVNNINVYMARN